MSELYFVRHGQAAFGTEDYDRLTPLGVQQSQWLGEYFAEQRVRFDRVLTGTLLRHRETLKAMNGSLEFAGVVETQAGLDEFAHEALHEAYTGQAPQGRPAEDEPPRHFYRRLELALRAWAAGRLGPGVAESWQEFTGRVTAAVARACVGRRKRILVISSGGPMAVTLRRVLGLSDDRAIDLSLQIRNSAFSHFYFDDERVQLASFNNVPHLDRPERRHAITLT